MTCAGRNTPQWGSDGRERPENDVCEAWERVPDAQRRDRPAVCCEATARARPAPHGDSKRLTPEPPGRPPTAESRTVCDAGRSGKQASVCNILLRWAWGSVSGWRRPVDRSKAGYGAVHPLRSSRFLLMQAYASYRLARQVVVYALRPARQRALRAGGLLRM